MNEHSDSNSKYHKEDVFKILEFVVDNIFVLFGRKIFQQIVGTPLGSSPSQHISVLIRSPIQTVFSLGRKKQYLSLTSHIDISMAYCQLIIHSLSIVSFRYIPLSLRSKTRRRATLLLLILICSNQSRRTFNFALPFTKIVTISILIFVLN